MHFLAIFTGTKIELSFLIVGLDTNPVQPMKDMRINAFDLTAPAPCALKNRCEDSAFTKDPMRWKPLKVRKREIGWDAPGTAISFHVQIFPRGPESSNKSRSRGESMGTLGNVYSCRGGEE